MHKELNKWGFMRQVFCVETAGKERTQVMAEAMRRYAQGLGAPADDRLLTDAP